jgi:hypothetical protein
METIAELLELNFLIKIALFLLLVWPFVLIATAAFLSPATAVTVVPLIDMMPVVIAFFAVIGAPFALMGLGGTPSGLKALLWLAAAIGIELTIGVYLSTVPISKDTRLVPLLVLVALAASFLSIGGIAGGLVRLLILGAIVITAIFLMGGREKAIQDVNTALQKAEQSAASSERSHEAAEQPNAQAVDYNRSICDDAFQTEANHRNDSEDEQYFDIPLHGGCFSGWVSVPGSWRQYGMQMLSSPPDAWVSIWGTEWAAEPIGPYSRQQFNNTDTWGSRSTFTNRFRLEGKGTLRVYRTWPPPEPSKASAPPAGVAPPSSATVLQQPGSTLQQSAQPSGSPNSATNASPTPQSGAWGALPSPNLKNNQGWRRFAKKPVPPPAAPQSTQAPPQ